MRSTKGVKHYLVIVTVKDSFLMIRNQRKQLSCNDNAQTLGNKKYRLEYQSTKKSEILENSCMKDTGDLVSQRKTTRNIVKRAARQ